jgi:putative ABC transport system substrate-binding protein
MNLVSMIVRTALSLIVVASAFAASSTAFAQQPAKVYRVGMLLLGSPTTTGISPDAFRKDLGDLGYVEGRNLTIDLRWAEGHLERLPSLAAELVGLKPDVIMTFTTDGALAGKQATTTVPIVFMQVNDPVRSGLVASLAHPSGNMTGVTDYGTEIAAKRVELIHAIAPKAARIGVLVSDSPTHPLERDAIVAAATGAGLQVVPALDRSNEELNQAFASFAKEAVSGVIVLGGAQQGAHRPRITALSVKFGIPTISPTRVYVEQGGLMSYGVDLPATYTLAARYVDKILKGAKPGDLPVEQPPKFEFVVNLKAAKALGITVPQSLLLRADEVVR